MAKILIFTPAQMQQYMTQNKKHKGYKDTVDIMNSLKVHADGEMPVELIKKRRPSESEQVFKYRQELYKPITKGPVSKVITSLAKIRKAPDWKVKYDQQHIPPAIVPRETLQAYLEMNFPFFKSFQKWTFDVCLKQYLIDPNGLIAVLPRDYNVPENEYLQPFPTIFNSDQVLDFEAENYAIIKSTDKATYTQGGTTFYTGEVYYAITTERIQKYEQIDQSKKFELTVDYAHGLGFLPVFRMGGLFSKSLDNVFIYRSRIDAMVPRLDEAAREYNDLQVEVVLHIHSESWAYAAQDCLKCNGLGRLIVEGNEAGAVCDGCKGSGKVNTSSPFANIVITPSMVGEQATPTPPKGYIQKDVQIVKIQDERVDAHIYKAYAAINMEFLDQTPLNQSGKAKEVDKDELNNFVNSIADDIVSIMMNIINITVEYRYKNIVPNFEDRQAMIPSIPVPDRFDLLSSDYLIGDIEKAKNINLNPVLANELIMGYAAKKFSDEPEVRNELQLLLELDPFPGMTQDNLITMLSNGGITKEDYIVNCNIYQFVHRALDEYEKQGKNFMDLEEIEQKAVIHKYAEELAKALEVKTKVLSGLVDPNNPNPAP